MLEHEGGVSERKKIWMGGETCIKPQLKSRDLLSVPINYQAAGKAGLIRVTLGEKPINFQRFLLFSKPYSLSKSSELQTSSASSFA